MSCDVFGGGAGLGELAATWLWEGHRGQRQDARKLQSVGQFTLNT